MLLQVRPGTVAWSHTASGEDMVSKQAYEVEENGKFWSKAWRVFSCTSQIQQIFLTGKAVSSGIGKMTTSYTNTATGNNVYDLLCQNEPIK